MKYRLIGLDLDGTLLRPDQRISDEDADAIAAAIAAGVAVVPCTGRAWHEARSAIAGIPGLDEGVFVTGALVTNLATGDVRDFVPFDPDLLTAVVDALAHLPEAVLVFRVPDRIDHDYLVTGRGAVTPNTRWWFDHTGARVVERRKLQPQDLQHCVRVAVVSTAPDLQHLVDDMRKQHGDNIETHSFPGVERTDEMEPVKILEVFPRGVTKWRGLRSIANRLNITDQQIAVIGDEINDLPAMAHAGCAVAMGNAIPAVKDAAHHTTAANTDSGVAHAIQKMLAGAW